MRVVVVLIAVGAIPAGAQPSAEPGCLDLIRAGIDQVKSNPTGASETLARAVTVCERDQEAGTRQQENLRWTLADLVLRQAEHAVDRCERYELANYAVNHWRDYIQWFTALDSQERSTLSNEQNRIQAAVGYMQNAVIGRGEPGKCIDGGAIGMGLSQLFSLMLEVPPTYVSASAMKKWKEWLWRCPTWTESPRKSYGDTKRHVCSEGQGVFCADDWRAYRDFLAQWLDEKSAWKKGGTPFRAGVDLTAFAINDFQRELNSIDGAFECEH